MARSSRPQIVVVGLGPAGPDLWTAATRSALDGAAVRLLRTERHPAATAVPDAVALDHLYESCPSLDEVYAAIVEAVVDAAATHGRVVYAVPGSPLVAERSVALLRDDPRVDVEVVPAMSFLELAWERLHVDPLAASVRLVDGRRFAVEAAGSRGPLLVAQCDSRAVLSDIKLSVESPVEDDVVVLHHLGLADESVTTVPWADVDRIVDADHLTSLYVPALSAPVANEVVRFAELVATLRQRCPWDREQTHQSLTRHLVEEAYEVLEAIDHLDGGAAGYAHLEEELGDLLFQVVFHATLAAEEGAFTLADVARRVHDKLVHRHPHVFGTVEADSAAQVMRNWEEIKKTEKGHDSLMDGIARDLPALLYAHKVQRKAASAGVTAEQVASLTAAVGEDDQATPEAVGDLLFGIVDLARRSGVDPESALRRTTDAFRRRFTVAEGLAADAGVAVEAPGPD